MEAQRFPNDYDGILAGAPAFNRTHLHMAGLYGWQNTHASPGRLIQPGQMTLINQAVLKQCVGRDGGAKTDQFLTDPRDCHFDPKVAALHWRGNAPPACLTSDQVTTMQRYYAGTIDPVNGQIINPGSERGNETDNILALGLALQEQFPEPAFDGLFYWVFGPSFGYPSSATNFANFDFHRDVDKVDDQLAAVLNATSTDLGDFRAHGGKLLMYHGWADPLIPSQSSINYFLALVGNEGHGVQPVGFFGGNPALQRTQSYARLFMAPGLYHCAGGPGPNTFDALTPLVKWVEAGVAPETILATKFVADKPPAVQMTRPLCVFPKVAKYNGGGDTNVRQLHLRHRRERLQSEAGSEIRAVTNARRRRAQALADVLTATAPAYPSRSAARPRCAGARPRIGRPSPAPPAPAAACCRCRPARRHRRPRS